MNQTSYYYPSYSYDRNYPMNQSTTYYPQDGMYSNDDRFFWAPFVVGGLAGTALGYGIANNNQLNHGGNQGGCCMNQPIYYYPVQPTPYMNNNFYY